MPKRVTPLGQLILDLVDITDERVQRALLRYDPDLKNEKYVDELRRQQSCPGTLN